MQTTPDLIFDGPANADRIVALAHGAGSGMDSPFMNFFANALAVRGYRVVRFEFPYRVTYRKMAKRKPPDREPVLRETWLKVVDMLEPKRLVIGGKSMGGRIASLVADEAQVSGLICLGYPFHPVGKPDRLRVEHLQSIKTPMLIVQGDRDPFGNREEVGRCKLSPVIRLTWMTDGDHSFKPRKTSGSTEEQNWKTASDEIATFLGSLQVPAKGGVAR
jgi:uncharacterized protein